MFLKPGLSKLSEYACRSTDLEAEKDWHDPFGGGSGDSTSEVQTESPMGVLWLHACAAFPDPKVQMRVSVKGALRCCTWPTAAVR